MATQKMIPGDLVFCLFAQYASSKERNPICQFTSTDVTIVGRSLNSS